MALRYPDLAEHVSLTNAEPIQADGTLKDITDKMTDGNLTTKAVTMFTSSGPTISRRAVKMTFNSGHPPAVSDFVRVRHARPWTSGGAGGSAVKISARAYISSSLPTITSQITLTPAVGSDNQWLVFSFTSAFISQLANLGGGKFAIRCELHQDIPPDATSFRTVRLTEGEGDFVPGAGVTHNRSVTMAGTGTTDVAFTRIATRTTSISGVGTTAITGTRISLRSTTMAGVGTTSVTAEIAKLKSVTMAGVGTTTLTRLAVRNRAVAIAGVGTLTASVGMTQDRAVTMAGVGSTTLSTTQIHLRPTTIAGVGTTTIGVDITSEKFRPITMSGVGTATLATTVTRVRSPAVSGVGTVTLSTAKTHIAQNFAGFTGVGTVTLATIQIHLATGFTGFAGVGTVTLTPDQIHLVTGFTGFSGTGTVSAPPAHVNLRSVTMPGVGTTDITAIKGGILIDLQASIELVSSMAGIDVESDGSNYWILG